MTPTASVVIPVHNRAALTAACLDALLAEPFGVDAEIIVVDDASTDDTLDVLAARPVRVVTHAGNTGFAVACNDGAAAASGRYVVFLNNDTLPRPGWLASLVAEADAHPEAAAVGARLLYPDGTVQHAGLVIGEDRNAHHVYAGFPGDHPAVVRSRAFQAVTGACLLVRRAVFEAVGGFDPAFRNGHEDVDLCLRLGEGGHGVRYCAGSVVVHLESVTRGRATPEAAANGRLYRERWAGKVEPDDLRVYADDGMLRLSYRDTHPVRLHVDPALASVHDGVRERETERLLQWRAAQVAELLGTVVALTTAVAPAVAPAGVDADDELALALDHVRRLLDQRAGRTAAPPSSGAAYRRLVTRIRADVTAAVPAGATVAVVSRGDDDLVELPGRTGWHFPADASGTWAGHHPADDAAAVALLDDTVRRGATHLVVPAPSAWWLDHYAGFTDRLRTAHRTERATTDCTVFGLNRPPGGRS